MGGVAERRLLQVTGQTSEDNESLVELKNLERNADAISDLYKTYLTRYQETAQNQSFLITAAQVFTATPRDRGIQSEAHAAFAGSTLGALFGMGVGGWREFRAKRPCASVRMFQERSA